MGSLLFVHKLLITMAVVFCAGFAIRQFVVAARSGDALSVVFAVASTGFGVGLVMYLRWVLRRPARFGGGQRPG